MGLSRQSWKISVYLLLLWLLLVLLAFTGCQGNSAPASAPKSPFKGYYASNQSIQGGEEYNDVNLKNMDVKQDGEDTVITLSFAFGSERLGIDEAEIGGVPQYKTGFLENPHRFLLQIDGLSFWDYKVNPDWWKGPLLQGMFKQIPVDDDSTILYFHVKQDIAYKVEASGDDLIIRLHPAKDTAKKAFYVMMNAFDEYQEGIVPEDFELSPVLCDSLMDVTLLSKPYNSMEEAEKKAREIEDKMQKLALNIEKTPEVVELEANQLPTYNQDADFKAVENKPVIKKNGQESPLPVLIPDGRFLCWYPDGESYLWSKPLVGRSDSEEEDISLSNEEIWLTDANGQKQKLMDYEFSTISKAAFSADGRNLAFIEQVDDLAVMYLYDMEKQQLSNLAEEGFGAYTANFAWSADGKILYAMSGEDELQLMEYNLTRPIGERVMPIEEKPGSDGDMGFVNGKIYFADEAEGEIGKIYSVDPSSGLRSEFTDAGGFSISPDGKWMAVMDIDVAEEESMETRLRVINLETGEEKMISDKKLVMHFEWSPDSAVLYYTVDRGVDEDDPFHTTLCTYNIGSGSSQELLDMVTSEFSASNKPGQLMLIDMYTTKGDYVPITYKLDLE